MKAAVLCEIGEIEALETDTPPCPEDGVLVNYHPKELPSARHCGRRLAAHEPPNATPLNIMIDG